MNVGTDESFLKRDDNGEKCGWLNKCMRIDNGNDSPARIATIFRNF